MEWWRVLDRMRRAASVMALPGRYTYLLYMAVLLRTV